MQIRSIKENEKVKGQYLGSGTVSKKNGQEIETIALETETEVVEFWYTPSLKRAFEKAGVEPGQNVVIYRGPDQSCKPTEETRKAMGLGKDAEVMASQVRVVIVPDKK